MSLAAAIEVQYRVEQFLYAEAALLDDWSLDAWFALFTPECRYEVTPLGEDDAPTMSPTEVYFLIADDRERLAARVERMKSPAAHVESPRSRTRHLYTNVRVEHDDGTQLTVWFNFHTFRHRNRQTFGYMGRTRIELVRDGEHLRIAGKRVMLDMDALIPQGKVSIFL